MTYFADFFSSDPKNERQTKATSSSYERKKHKNKYKDFSVAVEDRSEEEYMEKIEELEKRKEEDKRLRQTTIPTTKITVNKAIKPTQNKNSHKPNATSQVTTNRTKIRDMISDLSTVDPADPYTFGYIEIGEILIPHGINGEMKLEIIDPIYSKDLIKQLNQIIYLKKPDRRSPRPIKLLSCRKQTTTIYLIQLDGIISRMKANLFRKYKLYILKSEITPLSSNEYYIRDLIGLNCFQCNNQSEIIRIKPFATVVGIVPPDELCDNPALAALMHSLLEIQKIGTKELCLIPFVPQIVREVDIEQRRVLIDPPVGLLEMVYVAEDQKVVKGLLPARIDWLSEEVRSQLEKNTIITSTIQKY